MKTGASSIRRFRVIASLHLMAAAPMVLPAATMAEGRRPVNVARRGHQSQPTATLERCRGITSNDNCAPERARENSVCSLAPPPGRKSLHAAGPRQRSCRGLNLVATPGHSTPTATHFKAGVLDRKRNMLRCAGPGDAPEEDIRGPREPVEIPVPDKFSLTPWLVGAGVLAAVGLLFWWWRKRRARQRDAGPVDRALSALEEIDRVRNSMDAAPLADRAADVVRRFIAEKFGIAAPRRTTEEFLHAVSADPSSPLGDQTPLLRGFLKSCDMAKFAGTDFDSAERLELLAGAFRFVRAADSPVTGAPPLSDPHTA